MTSLVSVIVPCFNEEQTISLLLDALIQQTFPRFRFEVVIADGLSTDQTRQRIADYQKHYPDLAIRIVDNSQRNIPAGLNRAIEAARGEILVRLDAHSAPRSTYLALCVEALEKGLGDSVGGVWEIVPRIPTWQARGIATAAAHPLGVGDAHYRYAQQARQVDTVPFGSFHRRLVDRIGYFDETLLTNEDYEFNVRIRQAGGKIWLDPAIRSTYFARSNLVELARQYWRYGYWKANMILALSWYNPLEAGLASCLCIQFVGLIIALDLAALRTLDNHVRISGLHPGDFICRNSSSDKEAGYWIDFRRSTGDSYNASKLGERVFMEHTGRMDQPKQIAHTHLWQLRIGERQVLLVVGDLLVAILSLFVSLFYWGANERFTGFSEQFLQKRVPIWFYILPLIWVLIMVELYDVHRASDWGKTVRGVAIAALIGLILYLLMYFYYSAPPKSLLPRRGVASYLVAVSLLTLLWRRLYIKIFTTTRFMRHVLIIGGGKTGRIMLRTINSLKNKPFHVVGVIDDDPKKLGQKIDDVPVIGSSAQLNQLSDEHNISDIIVAIGGEMRPNTFQALLEAQERGVDIIRMPIAYEELVYRVPILSLEADWILRTFVDQARGSGFYELAKRLLDILGALIGLTGLAIVLPFIAVMTLLDDGWPIFYGQTRSGRGGQPYEIIKFRTMRRDAEADGQPRWAQEGDARATRVGRFLRKTHLDEVPQFINVLRGEMSLVGPRGRTSRIGRNVPRTYPILPCSLVG